MPEPLPDLEGRVLNDKIEKTLSKLHSMVSEEDIPQLVKEGYGSAERIREVKADLTRLISLVIRGNKLSASEIAHVNLELGRARPVFLREEARLTYVIMKGDLVDLAYAMFATYLGTGRMRECAYQKCQRIYVPDVQRGGRSEPKYCDRKCFTRATHAGYLREWKKRRARGRKPKP